MVRDHDNQYTATGSTRQVPFDRYFLTLQDVCMSCTYLVGEIQVLVFEHEERLGPDEFVRLTHPHLAEDGRTDVSRSQDCLKQTRMSCRSTDSDNTVISNLQSEDD